MQVFPQLVPPAADRQDAAMDAGVPRTLPKADLLRALTALRTLGREYQALLDRIWEEDAPNDDARRLLAGHRELARAAEEPDGALNPFAVLGPAEALLGHVTAHLRTDPVTFRLASRAPAPPGDQDDPAADTLATLSRELGHVLPPLEALAAQVYAQARTAPTVERPRVQRVLYPVAALFKAIVRQDWSDAALVMDHLNMVTTSRENHELVEQVGRLVRSIYDSLNEISRDVPVESLSHVTEEIPDAVGRLHSVIAELEDGANSNLDLLEALSGQVNDGRKLAETARTVLDECDGELAALAESHPEAGEALAEVRALLVREAGDPLATFQQRLQESHDLYMTLFANQSYQDLTGQTLKKVIAFIEGLQYQLIQVISKESGKTTAPEPAEPGAEPSVAGPDAHNRLSQERVDAMLAELGF